jgi:hypothetical protein
MAIDKANFAEECIRHGLYCGVNPHYILAVAQKRSEISDTNDNDMIGPFRLKQADWNASCTDAEFDYHFLPDDINDWNMQIPVFALMAHRAFDAYVLKNNTSPSTLQLYLAQWPGTADPPLQTDLQKALDDTAPLIGPAATVVLDDAQNAVQPIGNVAQQPGQQPAGQLKLTSIAQAQQPMAQKIVNAFANAGMGIFQQASALANAIAESNLNPNAHAAIGEDSWGLFQLNRSGGLGKGHNPDELVNPDRNIAIVIAEAKKYGEFTAATTLPIAVSAFVRDVERPGDISGEIVKRLKIAQRFVS